MVALARHGDCLRRGCTDPEGRWEESLTIDKGETFVATHLRRNFTALALDYGFFGLGMSFASTATILPALAEQLGASNLIIGAFPSLILLGRSLPALFSARLIEPLPRKLPFVLTYTVWERVPWLLLAAAVLILGESNPGLVTAILVATLAVVALVGGALSPAWVDLVARVIPMSYRGRFFAIGAAFSTGLGLAGAVFSGYLLQQFSFPAGYAMCLAAAFLCLLASYAAMAMALEPPTRTGRTARGLRLHMARLPLILRANNSFAWYLGGRGLAVLGMMAMGFYTVHALRSLGAAQWNAASFTFALLASQAAGGLVLGVMADHAGHKITLLMGAAAATASNLLALATDDLVLFHGVFILMGMGVAATNVSSQNLVMELSGEEERPTYLGLASTAQAPFALVAPLMGGILADRVGLEAVFAAAALLSGVGALIYMLRVVDPRRKK